MSVTVMSRAEAVAYCRQTHESTAVMISISDPYMQYTSRPFCSAQNNVRHILQLSFADADQPGPDVYGREAAISDLMSDEDAQRVAEFVDRHRGQDIIVHCDAGISRSSGVAAAILKYMTGDDSAVFDDPWYHPNMWCYRKTLTALMVWLDT